MRRGAVKCGEVQRSAGKCGEVLGGAGRCGEVMASAGRCGELLKVRHVAVGVCIVRHVVVGVCIACEACGSWQITSLDTSIGVVVVEKVFEHSKAYHLAHFWFHVAWTYPKHMGKRVPATTATNVMSMMATVVLAKVISPRVFFRIRFG